MPQQKYAIRCSTEEQARECYKNDILFIGPDFYNIDSAYYVSQGLEIISYDEAISLGLLGGKKGESPSEDKEVGTPYMDYLERKESPSEDNLVENPIEKAVNDVSKKMYSELDRWILQLIKDRFRLETYYNGNTVRYELYTQYGKKPLGELEINLYSK